MSNTSAIEVAKECCEITEDELISFAEDFSDNKKSLSSKEFMEEVARFILRTRWNAENYSEAKHVDLAIINGVILPRREVIVEKIKHIEKHL